MLMAFLRAMTLCPRANLHGSIILIDDARMLYVVEVCVYALTVAPSQLQLL